MIGVLEFRTENNHYAILQKVIELYGVRVEALTLQIVEPKGRWGLLMWRPTQQNSKDVLFLRLINLETDDISILDLALSKCRFRFHKLDHSGFDFLRNMLGRQLREPRELHTSYSLKGVPGVHLIRSLIMG